MLNVFDLFIAFFFLLMNAFFVLAEFAIVKVRLTRLEELSAKGITTAKIAKEIVKDIEAYLSAIQLGITMASLGLGWIGEPALAGLINPVLRSFGIPFSQTLSYSISFGLAFIVITAMHVIIGEQVPKYMAIRMPDKFAIIFAIPMKIFYKMVYWPMLLINSSSGLILRLTGIKTSESEMVHSDDELRMILGQSEEHGRISLGRLMMFEHLFDFGKTAIKEIMTPRNAIVFLSSDRSWEENIKLIKEKKFSRYPIARTSVDDISGFIHFKDVALDFPDKSAFRGTEDILRFKRNIHSISEEHTAERALREFQEKKMQITLVRNSAGTITGLLTIEDIVEELTGALWDEFDRQPRILLSDIMSKEASEFDIVGKDRFGAIGQLLEKLHAVNPVFDKNEALRTITEREINFSTALGHQIAFPHARMPSLAKPLLAIGKSKDGIAFPAPDNQPVKVIFLILTPFNEPTLQLNILSQLSSLVSNLTLRKRLFSAETISQLVDIVKAFENKVMK